MTIPDGQAASTEMRHNFARDASLLLIGMRCAGKSSLASIAAKALHWKVVDEKLEFQKATGCSVGGYIEKHGVKAYCIREVQILRGILEENQKRRIIVCSSSCVETQAGRVLLHQYVSLVPIVHVMRDAQILKEHLESKWQGDVAQLIRSQEPVYFSSSNLSFFNIDDTNTYNQGTPESMFEAVVSPLNKPTSRSLSLKRVESDFLRFLGNLYGWQTDDRSSSDDPNRFNYVLELPFGDFKHPRVRQNLEAMVCLADVLEIRTEILLQGYLVMERSSQVWWEYVVDQLAFLRRHGNQPILYHAVPPGDELASLGLDYFDLVHLGLRVGAEFLTIDLTQDENRVKAVTGQKGHSKIVGWVHEPDPAATGGWESQRPLTWYKKAVSLGCDMVHLSQPAVKPSDNALALCFARAVNEKGPIPMSAYNTGRLGRHSQCFNRILTMVRHPDVVDGQSESITIPQAQAALFSSFACEPLKFTVLGANVHYSVAPTLHNSAYAEYGMPHEYSITQADDLAVLDTLIQDDHFGGVGLTAPFKTEVIPRLQYVSDEARAIGAVNTIMPIRHWVQHAGEVSLADQRHQAGPVLGLYGENNDWKAIKACALRYLSPANAINPLSTALVVGAGGMARAAVFAMIRSGIRHLCIYNRTLEHAMDLIRHYQSLCDGHSPGQPHDSPITITALRSLHELWPGNLKFPTIVINCSPVLEHSSRPVPWGPHKGSEEPGPAVSVPAPWLRSPTGGVYMELAYNSITSSPELIHFCSESKREWIGVAGLEIFLEVATAQFEFWTGRRAPRHRMKASLGRYLEEMAGR
jgi:shikimate 5-dehydrogenase/shikimate kinase